MLVRTQNEEDALVLLKNEDYVTGDELSLITDVYEVYQNTLLGYEKVQKLLEGAESTVLSLPKTYKGNEEQQQKDAELTRMANDYWNYNRYMFDYFSIRILING